MPASAVDEVTEHWPQRCACGHVFGEAECHRVGDCVRHQIEELSELTAAVTERRALWGASADLDALLAIA